MAQIMPQNDLADSGVESLKLDDYIPISNSNEVCIDLKDQIIRFQKTQKLVKESIIETEVALKSPQMKYRESILQSVYNKQKIYFQSFCQQFKDLAKDQRRPYETMFRKFKEKISQHRDEIRLALDQPNQYKRKLESVKQVWFENEETQEPEWKFLMRGLFGILGAFMIASMVGAGNRFPLINNLVSSFYKLTSDPHLDVKKNGFVAPLQITCMGLTLKLGLNLCNTYGPIKVIVTSVIGMISCIFTTSFMDEFAQFVLFNNVLYGICAGMIFLTVLREPHKYFPKYKLVSNAFVLMGVGLGSVMFGVMNSQCMNPLHQKSMDTGYYTGGKDYIAKNLPPCWRLMAIFLLVIGSVGTALFYPLTAYNRREEEIKLQKGQVQDFENSCYTDEQGLKSHVFWILVVLVVFGMFGNYYITANFKNYAKGLKDPIFKSEDFLIYVQLTGQLTGAFCSLFWALSIRSIGFKYTYILACIIDISVYISLIKFQLDQASFIVVIVIHFIVQSAWMIIFSNACLLIFGDIIGESIYSYYWAFFAITSFSQYFLSMNIAIVVQFLKVHISPAIIPTNNYKLFFYPAILFSLFSIIVCSLSKLQGRWQNSLKLLTFKCQESS